MQKKLRIPIFLYANGLTRYFSFKADSRGLQHFPLSSLCVWMEAPCLADIANNCNGNLATTSLISRPRLENTSQKNHTKAIGRNKLQNKTSPCIFIHSGRSWKFSEYIDGFLYKNTSNCVRYQPVSKKFEQNCSWYFLLIYEIKCKNKYRVLVEISLS